MLKCMAPGLATSAFGGRKVYAHLPDLARAGLGCVEISGDFGAEHWNYRDSAEVAQLRQGLGTARLLPCAFHPPFGSMTYDLSHPDPAIRTLSLREVSVAIEAFSQLEMGGVVAIHPSGLVADEERRLRWSLFLDSLASLMATVGPTGMSLAVENLPPGMLMDSTAELEMLLRDVGDCRVGVCLDIGHAHLSRATARMIAAAESRLLHIHVHDNDGHTDQHLMPGLGTIDWRGVVSSLGEVGYRGAFLFEVQCPGRTAKEIALAVMSIYRGLVLNDIDGLELRRCAESVFDLVR